MNLLAIAITATLATGAKPSAFDQAPPTKEAYVALAKKLVVESKPRLGPAAREPIERELAELDALPDGAEEAQRRMAGFVLMGFTDAAVLYAAYSAQRAPEDVSAANNLGATLRLAGSDEALPVLLYARALAPEDPEVLVNLGNVAVDLRDEPRAASFFKAALARAPQSGDALQGLGACALMRGDLREAFVYFARANGVTYRESTARRAKTLGPGASEDEGEAVPPEPIEAPSGAASGGGEEPGSTRVTGTKLEVPPAQRYSGPDAYMAAQGGKDAARENDRLMTEAMNRMNASLQGLIATKMKEARGGAGGGLAVMDAQAEWATETNDAWLLRQTGRITEDMAKALEPEAAKYGKSAEQAAAEAGVKLRRCSGEGTMLDAPECQSALIEICKKNRTMLLAYWERYDKLRLERHARTAEALEKYFRAQAGWIRHVQDKATWQLLNARREYNVRQIYWGLLQADDIGRMTFAGAALAGFGVSAERCPKDPEPAAPEKAEEKVSPLQVEETPRIPCPFEKHPLRIKPQKVGGFKVGVTLTCKEVSLEGSWQAFSASWKREFRRQTTIHLEAKAGGTVDGPKGTKLKGELSGSVDIVTQTATGATMVTTGIKGEAEADFQVAKVKLIAAMASDFPVGKAAPKKPGRR
jgi:tetratricopeptide (TPR) repeat protein